MPGEMRVSVKAGRGMAHQFLGLLLVAIGGVAAGPEFFFAKETFATTDGERNDHAVAFFKFRNAAADFDDFTHRFVPEDIAFFHRRHVMIVKMKIRSADGS